MALSYKNVSFLVIFGFILTLAFTSSSQPMDVSAKLLQQATAIEGQPLKTISLLQKSHLEAVKLGNRVVVVKSLTRISEYYWDLKNYDSAKNYANDALLRASQYSLDSLKGDCWLSLGMISYSKGEFKKSISEYNKAISEYQKANQTYYLATALMNIGISDRKLSQYTIAIANFTKAAAIFENTKHDRNLALTFNSIAGCFSDLDNLPKALEYYRKALIIRQKMGDNVLISSSLNNVGYLFFKAKKADSAIYYLNKSFDLIRNYRDSSELVLTLQNLGGAWRMKGDIKKAENYIKRAQRIAADYQMGDELGRGNADLAEIYLSQNKYAKALSAINITIDTAKKEKALELLLQGHIIKYKIYKRIGDFKNALHYAEMVNELKDTIFNSDRDNYVTEAETKFQTKQKERDIISLREKGELQQKINNQQHAYIIVLAFAAILLAILFVIAYNNFRKKNKANERIQTLMRDLHHRVKNNLQILQGLFSMQIDNLSDEKTKNALRENEARLTSMNLIHSRLYLDNTTTKIEMSDYLTKLLNHIKDSFSGYGQNEINLKIEVSNIMLEADKAVAIGLIANELTTNSFKYAFNGAGGEIHLALQLVEKSKILLTLGDNGVGLKPETKDKAPSFGLKLVNLMARQLNSTLVVKSNPGVFYQMEISI